MKWVFRIVSALYISAIFLFAGSPIVSDLSPLNPYSLLHIPIYGILALLLAVSLSSGMRGLGKRIHWKRLFLAGSIALFVAVADEIHQSSFEIRHASVMDVVLDLIGICLTIIVVSRFLRK
jgi:VanZ family protein